MNRTVAASLVAASLAFTGAAQATVVGVGAFTSGNLIDFNDGNPANTQLGAFYAAQGVANMDLCGGQTFQTGPGPGSEVASNFFEPGCDNSPYGPKQITFGSVVVRAGFDITTNPDDDTTITAFLGAAVVGSHVFDTFGAGFDGSFAGIEFLSGFDRIEISSAVVTNGAFS